MSAPQTLAEELAGLIAEAESKGLWISSRYQELWFSPDELRRNNARGAFLWSRDNWKIADPTIHLETLRQRASQASRDVEDFAWRLELARFRGSLGVVSGGAR
jgi:hypothetical protein